MSRDLIESDRGALLNRGTRQLVRGSQLIGQAEAPNDLDAEDNPTLRAGEPVPVFARKVESDTLYAWGYGSDDRQEGRNAFIHSDFKATGGGTGVDGDSVTDAEVWLRVMGPRRRRVKAEVMLDDAGDLSDAASDARTEKPLMPVLEPAAKEDRWIEIALVAYDPEDGVEIDSDSDVKLYYTDINMA